MTTRATTVTLDRNSPKSLSETSFILEPRFPVFPAGGHPVFPFLFRDVWGCSVLLCSFFWQVRLFSFCCRFSSFLVFCFRSFVFAGSHSRKKDVPAIPATSAIPPISEIRRFSSRFSILKTGKNKMAVPIFFSVTAQEKRYS